MYTYVKYNVYGGSFSAEKRITPFSHVDFDMDADEYEIGKGYNYEDNVITKREKIQVYWWDKFSKAGR